VHSSVSVTGSVPLGGEPAAAHESAESRACADVIQRLSDEPGLPGALVNAGLPRALVLGRARAEPVIFTRAPQFDEHHASPEARALRADLGADPHPAQAFERALLRSKAPRARPRSVLDRRLPV